MKALSRADSVGGLMQRCSIICGCAWASILGIHALKSLPGKK